MYLLIEILISCIFSIIPLATYYFKKNKNKENFKNTLIATFILLIGCLIRTFLIEKYPVGLNQDEASIGYEAFSILNYGIDRNGMSYPLHFIAWNSGQNALYGYIIIPFIKLFGVSTFAIRLPMTIIGCLTLLVAYYLFTKAFDNKKRLIALFIFAIIPWHIMKSRFGLESNIFPDLIFYSFCFIYFGITNNKKRYFILSSIILGISTYAYGTSYLFVPIFSLLMYGYLIYKKKITIKSAVLYLLITGIISLPMILFTIINYFKIDTIKIFNMTIPRLYHNRFTEVTAVNGNLFFNSINNLLKTFGIIIFQRDEMLISYSPKVGILYLFSLPFIILGAYNAFLGNNRLLKLNNILFISSMLLAMFTDPNIVRINVLWISMIIYLVNGIVLVYNYKKIFAYIIFLVYSIFFILFGVNYFTKYQDTLDEYTFYGLEDAINYASKLEYDNLHITSTINQPYIFYLLYNEIDPNFYINNNNIIGKNEMFHYITRIDNVYFYLPNQIDKVNDVYILYKSELNNYDISDEFNVISFNNYSVIERTNK